LGERGRGFFENGERGTQADGGGDFGIGEHGANGGQSVAGELMGLVAPEDGLVETSERERLAEIGRTKRPGRHSTTHGDEKGRATLAAGH